MPIQEIEPILSDLRNLDKNVRAEATDRLIKSGTKAVPYLLPLLDDDDWIIRYRSLEALSGIRDTGTIEAIIKKTDDPKDHVRYMAAKALGFMDDERVIDVLARMLSDDHSYTRKIAAEGLARLEDTLCKMKK